MLFVKYLFSLSKASCQHSLFSSMLTEVDSTELIFLNALNSIPGVGVATLRLLKNRVGSFEQAWKHNISSLAFGAFQKPIQQIINTRISLNPEQEFKKLEHDAIWMIAENDPSFPPQLREIPHAPLFLYGKGERLNANHIHVGIVGTRRPTTYGKEVAATISTGLAHHGLTIVSGLAVGIDTIAHETALAANSPTIAVIGSGLDERSLFPKQNTLLARRITTSGGTVISEYAPGTPPLKEHFPMRNRIIAGLSRGVCVIEARERSGALITAQCALEQNRDVFAVPGSIFSPTSAGTNLLIQQGAKLVLRAQDICEEWGIKSIASLNVISDSNLDSDAKIMIQLLEQELTIDELQEKTKLDTPLLMSLLTLLELKGYIRAVGNNAFQKI